MHFILSHLEHRLPRTLTETAYVRHSYVDNFAKFQYFKPKLNQQRLNKGPFALHIALCTRAKISLVTAKFDKDLLKQC